MFLTGFVPLHAQIERTFTEIRQYQKLPMDIEPSKKVLKNHNPIDLLLFLFTLELMFIDATFASGESGLNKIPKYVNSLHLLNPDTVNSMKSSTSNFPSYVFYLGLSFENTFFTWLNDVYFKQDRPHMQQHYTQGFGPRISI